MPVTLAVLDIYTPGIDTTDVVYSESFAGGAGGWTAGANTTQSAASGYLKIEPSSGQDFSSSRAITGLTPGEVYTVSASVKRDASAFRHLVAAVSVTGQDGASRTPSQYGSGVGSAVALSHTFRATATSHTVVLSGFVGTETYSGVGGTAGALRFDDVTVCREPALDGFISGTLSLDENRTPYGEGIITIATPSIRNLLDPRSTAMLRVFAVASRTVLDPASSAVRTFNLYLHGNLLAAAGATTTLTARTDEAMLLDASQLEEPSGPTAAILDPRVFGPSLRDMIDVVLFRHGGKLEAGSDDADYTITHDATNLMINPGAEVNTTGAVAVNANTTLARSTAQHHAGVASYSCTAIGAGNAGLFFVTGSAGSPTAYMPVTGATNVYRFTCYVRTSVTRDVVLTLRYFSTASTVIGGADESTSPTTVTAGVWTRLTAAFIPPATATFVGPFVTGVSLAAGNVLFVDSALLYQTWSDESDFARSYADIEPFDGATASDAHYNYAWTGTANASTSTKTRSDDRDQMVLRQPLGMTDWAYLSNLVFQAGLDLFCNEKRQWFLVDPDTYLPAGGPIELREAVNLKDGSDDITLEGTRPSDGTPVWFTGVVIRYAWIDPDTLENREEFAVAGDRRKVLYLERSIPYPGDGEATRRLAAGLARGRVQNLTALADLTATPGQAVETEVPDVPEQAGILSSVSWAFSAADDAHDVMTVATRDLEDA